MSPADRPAIGPIDHVAVVVRSIDASLPRYRDLFGLVALDEPMRFEPQRVRLCFLGAGSGVETGATKIELIEPLDDESGVARFLAARGEGLHHVCFRTRDLPAELAALAAADAELIDREPRPGAHGSVAFVHPRTLDGVLWELLEPSADVRDRRPRWVATFLAGPRWDPALPMDEQAGIGEHRSYQAGLELDGRSERGGPFLGRDEVLAGRDVGMAVFIGDDPAAVERLLNADPAVSDGLLTYELRPWMT